MLLCSSYFNFLRHHLTFLCFVCLDVSYLDSSIFLFFADEAKHLDLSMFPKSFDKVDESLEAWAPDGEEKGDWNDMFGAGEQFKVMRQMLKQPNESVGVFRTRFLNSNPQKYSGCIPRRLDLAVYEHCTDVECFYCCTETYRRFVCGLFRYVHEQ